MNSDSDHDFKHFMQAGLALQSMDDSGARGDVKGILESVLKGESYFRVELERLKAKYKSNSDVIAFLEEGCKLKKCLFDACLFYDLWFTPETEATDDEQVDNNSEV